MTPATFDFERARFNMIEQQIRPWDVLDPAVLELLSVVRRELFVPPQFRALAFSDMEVPLKLDGVDTGETMLAPKVEARFLQELGLKAHESVLEIGTGSGYMAALAAHRSAHVISVEILPSLVAFARANLQRAGVRNVRVESGDGAHGWAGPNAPSAYDAIIVSGSLPALPPSLQQQLKVGGRMAVIVGDGPVMYAQIVTRIASNTFDTRTLFETWAKPLANAWHPQRFKF
jgi:protein-L-isoaspartate(D-aspartate) O-methyltransferase